MLLLFYDFIFHSGRIVFINGMLIFEVNKLSCGFCAALCSPFFLLFASLCAATLIGWAGFGCSVDCMTAKRICDEQANLNDGIGYGDLAVSLKAMMKSDGKKCLAVCLYGHGIHLCMHGKYGARKMSQVRCGRNEMAK